MNKIKKIDDTDLFLNNAYWSNIKYENFYQKRSSSLIHIINLLESLNLKYFLTSNIYSKKNYIFDKRNFDEIYIPDYFAVDIFIKKLLENKFEVFESSNFYYILDESNILIKINNQYKKTLTTKEKILYLNDNRVNVITNKNLITHLIEKILNKVFKRLFKRFVTYIYIVKIIGLKNALKFDKKKIYPLSKRKFLKLNIESRNSFNWLLRKEHLDLITNNKNILKIKEIVKYFKYKENLKRSLEKVNEVDTTKIFDEPIHLNKKFWKTGNNFFIYPIFFGFRKDVVPYKKSNDYIAMKNEINLYSYNYYENLTVMTDEEVENFLKQNPIEITNLNITSGRHRVCAMINRLINDKDYINFYVRMSF